MNHASHEKEGKFKNQKKLNFKEKKYKFFYFYKTAMFTQLLASKFYNTEKK